MSDQFSNGLLAGTTSFSMVVELRKTSDNTEQTGKAYTDVTASYLRQGGVQVDITAATLGSVNAAYSSGGFIEVSAAKMPGIYRFDVPNAAIVAAAGVNWVTITVLIAGCFAYSERINLQSVSLSDVSGRIPASAPNTNGGLPVLSSSGTTLGYTVSTVTTLTGHTPQSGDGYARIGANGGGLTALAPAATALSTAQWSNARASLLDFLDAAISTRSTYAGADTAGVTTLLARLTSTRAGLLDFLDAAISTRAATGAAMTLTSGERATLAAAIETAIIDDTDGHAVKQAIVDKIASMNPDLSGLSVAAIASAAATAVWGAVSRTLTGQSDSAGITTLLTRLTGTRAGLLDNLDALVSSRSTYDGSDTAGVATLLTRLTNLRAAQLDHLDADVSSRSTYAGGDTAGVTTLLTRLTGTRAGLLDNLIVDVATAATRLLTAMALNAGNWRFTAAALALAPVGEGGGGGGGTAPTGPSAVTLTFVDSDEAAVSLVEVTITGQGWLRTGVNGVASFGLPDGTFQVNAWAAGVLFAVTELVVAGDTALTITGTNIAPIVAPPESGMCRVHGYFEKLDGTAPTPLEIYFVLAAPGPTKGTRLVVQRRINAHVNTAKQLADGAGHAWLDLQRNDLLTPAGTHYLVYCAELGWDGRVMTLTGEAFDLLELAP